MNYRGFEDLNLAIRAGFHKLPRDLDLVVGVPRSGLLPASLIALHLDAPLTDIDGLLAGRLTSVGKRHKGWNDGDILHAARHVLIVDDSVNTGRQLQLIRERIAEHKLPYRLSYCAIYATHDSTDAVDVFMEIVPAPRIFEWNILHSKHLARCCVDIDGVLCLDPSDTENDDGASYATFLRTAQPLFKVTWPIGWLVTSRLDKYRQATEAWLKAQELQYQHLVMLNVPDAATRRRLVTHAEYKGNFFRSVEAELFIESDERACPAIAEISGKDVVCAATGRLFRPSTVSRVTGDPMRIAQDWLQEAMRSARFLRRRWGRAHPGHAYAKR